MFYSIKELVEQADLDFQGNVAELMITTAVSYTHLTLPTTLHECRSRWSPYH